MKRIGLIIIFWIINISLLCAQENGTYDTCKIEVDGLTREYVLYVPEGHDGTEEWPVVFLLHAFRAFVDIQIKLSEMYLVADTAKFFIVYPQGLPVLNLKNGITASGWKVPDYFMAEHDDVEFINSIIDDLIAKPEFVIDKNRIHSTGYSSGGRMSYYLALVLSNRIASVAGVAGQMSDTLINHICTPLRKISVLHMQGTNDFANPLSGNKYALPLEGVTEYWASVNGCNEIPDSTELEDINKDDSSTVTVFNYNNCDNDYEVLLYRINGGDHNWPGGWKDPDGPDLGVQNYDIHASAEIWNFFKRNPHPDPLQVTSIRSLKEMIIYPNPINTAVTIKTNISNLYVVKITSLNGHMMYNKELKGAFNQIDLSSFRKGVYFITIRSKNFITTRKIIKL